MTFNREKFKETMKDSTLGNYIDWEYVHAHEDPDDADDLREKLETMIREYEVIYYHKAMKYLSENDPSLRESLEIAREYGFDVKNLNSETLATIHLQDAHMQELGRLDLDDFFSEGE